MDPLRTYRRVVAATILCLVLSVTGWTRTILRRFRQYSTRDGLASNTQNGRMFEDSRGFMWFCTNNGLSWFDGARFHTFRADLPDTSTLYSPVMSGIAEDTSGNM